MIKEGLLTGLEKNRSASYSDTNLHILHERKLGIGLKEFACGSFPFLMCLSQD